MPVIHAHTLEDRPPDLTIREHRRLLKDANYAAGKHWHTRMLPKHFTTSARHTYAHKPRTGAYLKRKRNRARTNPQKYPKGGLVDNVLTGLMEQAARANYKIIPYPSRVRVEMEGPFYMLMRPYKSGQPDKGKETTTVTALEGEQLEKILGEKYERDLKRLRARKLTRIR